MATSKQLIEAVSRATGLTEETVHVHMRNLREAGLITLGGRGASAARMTPLDAARLMMAVSGSGFVKESVNAVASFAGLLAYRNEIVAPKERSPYLTIAPHWSDGPRHWSAGLPLMGDLNGEAVKSRFGLRTIEIGASFEDALVAVIEAMLMYTLFPRLQSTDFRKPTSKNLSYRKRLWVTFYRPEPHASMTYCAEGVTYQKILFQAKPIDFRDVYSDRVARKKKADLYRAVDFDEEALEIICEALVSELGVPVNRSKRKSAHRS